MNEYRTLSAVEERQVKLIKEAGQSFLDLCDSIAASREISLAKTKVEEAVMWAVKGITK